MKIKDKLVENKVNISFEVFPPKVESSFDSVKHATEEIAKLNPAFMSVIIQSSVKICLITYLLSKLKAAGLMAPDAAE